jgi:hypothetical protein
MVNQVQSKIKLFFFREHSVSSCSKRPISGYQFTISIKKIKGCFGDMRKKNQCRSGGELPAFGSLSLPEMAEN